MHGGTFLMFAFRAGNADGDGVEQYIDKQPFIQVSKDLANAAHVDPGDDGRCHAVFMRRLFLEQEPQGWFLLFPDVGLAVELCHGACVSWDGREARHCTSIAHKANNKDVLWSYYFGLNKLVASARDRLAEFELAAQHRQRCAQSYPAFVPWMKVKVKVSVNGRDRIRDATVVDVSLDMVHIAFDKGKDAKTMVSYAAGDQNIVIASCDL